MARHPEHPFVTETFEHNKQFLDANQELGEKLRGTRYGLKNKDGDIAVQVDSAGTLLSLWIKPGTSDRRGAKGLAKEINTLLAAATTKAHEASWAEITRVRAECLKLLESGMAFDPANPFVPPGATPARAV